MRSIVISGFSILFLLYNVLCSAQSTPSIKRFGDHLNIKLAYISSLIYPGMSTGIEFPIPSVRERKLLKNPEGKAVNRDWFISGNLNWYHHPDFHDNLYLTAEWVRRRTKFTGFITEFSYGPGYSRTFLGGTTYEVVDLGSISVIKHAGYNYALLTVGWGCGYDFSVKKQQPFLIFAKGNMLMMFPYNSTIYFRPVLELGVRYAPVLRISKAHRQSDSKSKNQ
jgi:hypothetical protein